MPNSLVHEAAQPAIVTVETVNMVLVVITVPMAITDAEITMLTEKVTLIVVRVRIQVEVGDHPLGHVDRLALDSVAVDSARDLVEDHLVRDLAMV